MLNLISTIKFNKRSDLWNPQQTFSIPRIYNMSRHSPDTITPDEMALLEGHAPPATRNYVSDLPLPNSTTITLPMTLEQLLKQKNLGINDAARRDLTEKVREQAEHAKSSQVHPQLASQVSTQVCISTLSIIY